MVRLTEEQMEVVYSEADNTYVKARAGTGETARAGASAAAHAGGRYLCDGWVCVAGEYGLEYWEDIP